MNKLTIEEKKILAEKVIGWTVTFCGTQIMTEGAKGMPLSKFNPDQNIEQFVELIGKLDKKTRAKIDDILWHPLVVGQDFFKGEESLEFVTWLCSHKYEVCKAIMEVIG